MLRKTSRHRLAVLCLGLCCAWAVTAVGSDAEVRVMSYNVRVGTAADGINDWGHRREFLAETITAFAPDLLGTQETLDFQRDFIASRMPGYGNFGLARDAARGDGEMMTVFYRLERFDRIDGGHFWLSETPDVAGSRSWDSALPRMVTWVRLRDRRHPNSLPIVFMNTHFDHQGVAARLNAARLLRQRIEALAEEGPVILTGDFNSGDVDAPYATLFGVPDQRAPALVDSYRVVHPRPTPDEGTFSSFDARVRDGKRIDWIGVTRDWDVVAATIEHAARHERTPSDHFPVTAVLVRRDPAPR